MRPKRYSGADIPGRGEVRATRLKKRGKRKPREKWAARRGETGDKRKDNSKSGGKAANKVRKGLLIEREEGFQT